MKYTAVVLAGSRPGRDEFARQFGTDMKALVAVAGEPMVRRPVRALLSSKRIAQVVVVSQVPERIAAVIPSDPRIRFEKSATAFLVPTFAGSFGRRGDLRMMLLMISSAK